LLRCCFRATAAFLRPLRLPADDPTRIFHARRPERRFPTRLMAPALVIPKSDQFTSGECQLVSNRNEFTFAGKQLTNARCRHVSGRSGKESAFGERLSGQCLKSTAFSRRAGDRPESLQSGVFARSKPRCRARRDHGPSRGQTCPSLTFNLRQSFFVFGVVALITGRSSFAFAASIRVMFLGAGTRTNSFFG